jgi:hypothetical protein
MAGNLGQGTGGGWVGPIRAKRARRAKRAKRAKREKISSE